MSKFFLLFSILFLILIFPRVSTYFFYRSHLYSAGQGLADQTQGEWVLVLGSGLNSEGKASVVLLDRVRGAAHLYHQGIGKKILLSGWDSTPQRQETQAMKKAALALKVPSEALFLDGKGKTTKDSCKNAAKKFQIQKAILVSQSFHLPRALYLCHAYGIKAVGSEADQGPYGLKRRLFWQLREVLATWKAWLQRKN